MQSYQANKSMREIVVSIMIMKINSVRLLLVLMCYLWGTCEGWIDFCLWKNWFVCLPNIFHVSVRKCSSENNLVIRTLRRLINYKLQLIILLQWNLLQKGQTFTSALQWSFNWKFYSASKPKSEMKNFLNSLLLAIHTA